MMGAPERASSTMPHEQRAIRLLPGCVVMGHRSLNKNGGAGVAEHRRSTPEAQEEPAQSPYHPLLPVELEELGAAPLGQRTRAAQTCVPGGQKLK